MYQKFNLDLQTDPDNCFTQILESNYKEIGSNLFNEQRNIIQSDLKEFENMEGQLSGNQIIKEWFPNIKADIFLSHSHQDEDFVIGFAGWLYKNFGLTSFIDSTVWGYTNDLLKIIDDNYSLYPNSSTYDYNKRNYSTSHVHMMLSTSLMNMIDRCECIIFVNTPQSFTPSTDIKNQGTTLSPWIFSEILMSEMLRIRKPHRLKLAMDSVTASTESRNYISESLQVSYDIDMKHLTPLSISQLLEWKKKKIYKGEENLDALYRIANSQRKAIYG